MTRDFCKAAFAALACGLALPAIGQDATTLRSAADIRFITDEAVASPKAWSAAETKAAAGEVLGALNGAEAALRRAIHENDSTFFTGAGPAYVERTWLMQTAELVSPVLGIQQHGARNSLVEPLQPCKQASLQLANVFNGYRTALLGQLTMGDAQASPTVIAAAREYDRAMAECRQVVART
ncbi:hypothetical protein [Achromobacter xylosoxidans]|uniref:hypothetical protein n=1 Tax=Alcaligenes xylosoxydans xylosoxydans TaxID=85698 RepID=UPI001F10E587|nr:hypothetical protein [Achromobacter xylosoxidans]MCH4573125.1 hypothetical protein [Achromobacter xylosoxidans]